MKKKHFKRNPRIFGIRHPRAPNTCIYSNRFFPLSPSPTHTPLDFSHSISLPLPPLISSGTLSSPEDFLPWIGNDPSSSAMKNMAPSKDWMTAPRLSIEYLEGMESFFEFIKANKQRLGDDDWYYCPCLKCRNVIGGKKTLKDIRTHLICDGIDKTYTTWTFHGEIHPQNCVSVEANNNSEDELPRMVDMVNDIFERVCDKDNVQAHMGGSTSACFVEINDENSPPVEDESPENIQYKNLMEDAIQPLYPSCQIEHTKLSVTIDLLSMKARHQWPNNSFNELLQLFKNSMPKENTLPMKGQSRVAEDLDKIKKIVVDDPSSAYNDLENDAVAQTPPSDRNGFPIRNERCLGKQKEIFLNPFTGRREDPQSKTLPTRGSA